MGLLTNISLFSGAGGLDLGAKKVGGFRAVCYVELDPYAQAVLMSRIRGGVLDNAPIWGDVSTLDGQPWRGRVDVVSGGFPCQDESKSGGRKGFSGGARSSLWFQFARIVREVGPEFVLVENVPGLATTGDLGIVLGTLSEMGYDCGFYPLASCEVGGTSQRDRQWVVAHSRLYGYERITHAELIQSETAESEGQAIWKDRQRHWPRPDNRSRDRVRARRPARPGEGARKWEPIRVEPRMGGTPDGVAFRMDRLRLCGNGVDPDQSVPAWQKIKDLAGMT